MSKELFTIAFDLGGVIFATSNDTNIFSKNYLETELIPGIYDVILKLNKNEKNKLIIISKAYPNNAKKSREILNMYGLDSYFNSIIFCEKNESKAHIAKAMNVDVMIDDKECVLENFDKSIKTILFKESEINCLLRKIML